MLHISAVFSDWPGRVSALLARQFWIIALIVTVGGLATVAYDHMQQPEYEASAVVQVQAGGGAAGVAARILRRDSLLSIAARHGLGLTGTSNRDNTAMQLLRAISINDLTSDAGQTLGFRPQVAGLVVSVLLPDAAMAARVANDVAQQILDDGNARALDTGHEDLEFYRRDELRLWQELSALKTGQAQAAGSVGAADAALAGQRRLSLMQDQYDLLRQNLARAEIAARLSGHLQQGQFSLLRRATASEAVNVVQDWMLVGIAGSLLLAVTSAFVLERRFPALRAPWRELAQLHNRAMQLYRMFDDPARPILGIPRYAVTSGLIVVWLYLLASMIR